MVQKLLDRQAKVIMRELRSDISAADVVDVVHKYVKHIRQNDLIKRTMDRIALLTSNRELDKADVLFTIRLDVGRDGLTMLWWSD